MAYQSATASDVADLLDKLRIFLLANGWTVDFWGNQTAWTGKALSVHKGSFYCTFWSQTSGGTGVSPAPFLGVAGHTGWASNANPMVQAEVSANVYANLVTGPFVGYDFFEGTGANGPYCYLVVETQAGIFKHVGTCMLNKAGSYTGGQAVFGSAWYYNTPASAYISNASADYHAVPFDCRWYSAPSYAGWGQIRADYESATGQWLTGRDPSQAAGAKVVIGGWNANNTATSRNSLSQGPARSSPSTQTGRTVLSQLWQAARRTGDLYSPLGYPPDLRYVRLDNYQPKDVLTIGTDQWKVFPVIRRNGVLGEVNSDFHGYAYRINP